MVNVAREKGLKFKNITEDSRADFAKLFWLAVMENEVFVFAAGELLGEEADCRDDEPLDAPFRTFSIEAGGGFLVRVSAPDAGEIVTTCVMVHELSATKRVYFWLGGRLKDGELVDPSVGCDHSHVTPDHCGTIVRGYLDRLAVWKDGVEETKEIVRVPGKNPKKREYREVRRIFHIRPKGLMESPLPGEQKPRKINWSHRYSVRGHWVHFWLDKEARQLDESRLGKNRDGEYVERGRTWRTAFEKGPTDQPLVKKTRLVHDAKPQ